MKITIEINVGTTGFRQSYTLVETRAPRAYDYHGVIQIEDGGTSRIVAIPDEDLPVQSERYQSGMYGVTVVSEEHYFAERDILDLIVARMITSKW